MQALIVDDSRAMRRILRKIIEPLALQISEAENGVEGLQRLSEHPETELVFVDWNMPVMNGIDFVRALRSNPLNIQTKVFMVTSENTLAAIMIALKAGVDEFIMKPFTSEILLDKLRLIGVSLPPVD